VKKAADYKKKKWDAFLEWVKFNRENINHSVKEKVDQTREKFYKNVPLLERIPDEIEKSRYLMTTLSEINELDSNKFEEEIDFIEVAV
jgi:hypothetical protein